MPLLILFAFLAGVATILSPCILPILPIILSSSIGSAQTSKRRPLGIVTGYVLSFTFFTLFLSTLVKVLGVSADALRVFAIVVVIGFGIALLIPEIQVYLERFFSYFSQFGPRSTKQDFLSGVLVGVSLGLLWTPCVGPILASVISLALTGSVSGSAVLITLAYSIGTALPMLGIIYGGQKALTTIPWLASRTANIQKIFGVVMILTGCALIFNIDRKFQVFILEKFPQYGVGLTKIEDNSLIKNQLKNLQQGAESLSDLGKQTAPELKGGTGWLNSPPLALEKELRGKVVLIDFWTYSCINCIRTLPYLKKWHDSYKDKGLVIVGVHSPEFEFEKNPVNVQKAIKDFGIAYPVIQDNDFTIWKAYRNQYWPAKYLIDKNGKIVYSHFGEGKYIETENHIRELLGEGVLPATMAAVETQTVRRGQTPETYLGWQRAASYVRELDIQVDQTKNYTYSSLLPDDGVGLKGSWNVSAEFVESRAQSVELSIDAAASKTYLVMDTVDQTPRRVKVLLDGKPLAKEFYTADMNENGEVVVSEARKYDIADFGEKFERHVITLVFDEGVQAFAFTFGG